MNNNLVKLFIISFLIISSLNFISSWEFDNTQEYNEDKREYTITNALGLGENIAKIKLNSDSNQLIPRGYQKVAEFIVENYDDYVNVFNDMEFYDLKNNSESFTRDFDYKYKTIIQVPDYKNVCDEDNLGNGTIINSNCRQEQTGLKDQLFWEEINKIDGLIKGNITIGIFTDVQKGDRVEWIPTLFGERLTEWAVWTESLNAQLDMYWKLDESGSDTNAIDSVAGIYNLTGIDFDGDEWVTGLIGNAIDFDGTSDYLNLTTNGGKIEAFEGTSAEYTINFWINMSSTTGNDLIVSYEDGPGGAPSEDLYIFWGATEIMETSVGGGTQFSSVAGWEDNTWHMFTLVKNATAATVYGDGVLNVTLVQPGNAFPDNLFAIADNRNIDFFPGSLDEFGIWNRTLSQAEVTQLFNGGNGITFTDIFGPIVTLNSPIDIFNTTNQTINFNATVTSEDGITNVTLFIDGILNETNSSGINDTNYLFTKIISDGNHNWTYESCNSEGCTTATTRTFTISLIIENSQTFNVSSFETATESFTVNITTNGSTPSSAKLIYDGTTFSSATITSIGGNDFNISKAIAIPLLNGTKLFFFNLTIGGVESSSIPQNQIINTTNFTICGAAPQDIPFINITFKNETLSEEDITSTISSTWVYSLSTLSEVNKTLSFTDATENLSYTFCAIPNRTLNVQIDIDYDNSLSQQRSFSSTRTISNTLSTEVLYLLPTTLGLFSPFKTTNINGDTIAFVSAIITRVLGGSTITVANGLTDSSGFVTFFLNPNVAHTATFSKTGFADIVFVFTPTTDLRTVVMGGGGVISNGTVISRGTIYTISPRETTLANNTIFTFTLNVTSNLTTISLISMNITNSSNAELLFVSNAGVGNLSGTLNTGNNTKLIGYYIIETGEETISVTRTWIIFTTFIGDYSLFRQLTLVTENDLITDFNRLLIVLAVMFAIVIFMSVGQIIETSESKIAVLLLLTWAFSIVGWLDTGLAISGTNTGINRLGEFSNQYGIAILMTGASILFIFRRLFIRKPS